MSEIFQRLEFLRMGHPRLPEPAARRIAMGLCIVVVSASAGCGSPLAAWLTSYEEAERIAAKNGGIVFLYRDHLDTDSGVMLDAMIDPQVRALLARKVKCSLVTEYEPNRRYVAQYGVDSAPALIVIHPDQTYHLLTGAHPVDRVVSFLKGAKPPGKKPQLDPQVPRQYSYSWEGIYEDALEKARRRNRELLIVYKWWLSGESTELLRRMSRAEVARHLTNMVQCLLDWDYVPNRRHMADYGVQKVPAVVIVHRDGTYHARTGLCSIDDLVRFVVNAKPPGRQPGWRARAKPKSAYRWYGDFERASVLASRRRQSLLVFYHSVYFAEAGSTEKLLERSEVADLFTGMVHCKLDGANQENQKLMARYGADRVPAFVIIRPDGTYHARVGKVRVSDLVSLVRAAQRRGAVPVSENRSP